MLININEENYSFGLNCNICFDPGKAPEHIYASFSNILRGATWVPGDSDPPNGIFKLTNFIACGWSVVAGGLVFTYSLGVGVSFMRVEYLPATFAFFDNPAVQCEFNFVNDILVPAGNKYYGGECYCSWVEPPKDNSLSELCENLNINTDGLTDSLIYPVDSTAHVINMLRGTDQIKVLIKRDFA